MSQTCKNWRSNNTSKGKGRASVKEGVRVACLQKSEKAGVAEVTEQRRVEERVSNAKRGGPPSLLAEPGKPQYEVWILFRNKGKTCCT